MGAKIINLTQRGKFNAESFFNGAGFSLALCALKVLFALC